MKLKKIIDESVQEFITEDAPAVEHNLKLLHGSGDQKIFTHFFDNQFFTVNDYIASNYAFNLGGVMYEVEVSSVKPFELFGYHKQRESEKYNFMIDLLTKIYDEKVAENYANRFFHPSPSTTFMRHGWEPMIKWAKENGYDSLKFYDESFDTYIRDITYMIFKSTNVKIKNVYDVTEAVESNFSKPFKKLALK